MVGTGRLGRTVSAAGRTRAAAGARCAGAGKAAFSVAASCSGVIDPAFAVSVSAYHFSSVSHQLAARHRAILVAVGDGEERRRHAAASSPCAASAGRRLPSRRRSLASRGDPGDHDTSRQCRRERNRRRP